MVVLKKLPKHAYTPEMDEVVMQHMLDGLRRGEPAIRLFKGAAEKIGRKERGVINRWTHFYNVEHYAEIAGAREEGKQSLRYPRTRLKQARWVLGYSGAHVAAWLGVHKVHYNSMERGASAIMDVHKAKILECLRARQQELLGAETCGNRKAVAELTLDNSIFDRVENEN